MPLVAHTELPTFTRLREEGGTVLPRDYALHQDIRALHIGLLNMMPDAALAATERQFFRLVGESNQIAQFYMHPFTLPQLPRGPGGRSHVERFYEDFEDIKQKGLDALIITGANVSLPDLAMEPFWEPLAEIVDWAWHNVTSTLCSCLATHAVMQARYGERRRHRGSKLWGVFDHQVVDRGHPLVAGVNTRFNVPHSRFNDVSREQFERHGLRVLVESGRAGAHLAVSPDGFRVVFFQGHPEYDSISLLKEYKREVLNFVNGEREDFPPLPENYLSLQAAAILEEHRERVQQALARRMPAPALPEALLVDRLDNTWHDSALAVVNNWIGNVYQLTGAERWTPFRPGIDPEDPLDWNR
ncbi:homoserine O-succinyltransferase MetA [Thioalkalivibrio sp.]|uniref:homoserine O-succinyltransferase MetA n=1 Tax=Thioalkalivibrio sp. TaxID=2093813 RepID=UPI00356852E4